MTTATTTTSSKRAEANRRNARKSTGPKTPEGKERSKFNALKHGLDARTIVLPGEDAGAFQGRLDAWASQLRPRDDVEQILVERSATLSWQLERADRAQAARLDSIIIAAPAEAALRQADLAAALGQRLFQDSRGPLPLYPHSLYDFHGRPRVSASAPGDDPDAPSRLLLQLESTAAGCGWLLDRWGELGSLLDRGLTWQSPDKFKAIRLLGRQPLDAADSEVVALIFQACHVLDPQTRHAAGVERTVDQALADAVRVLDVMRKGAFSSPQDGAGRQADDLLELDLEEDEDFDKLDEPDASEDEDDDDLEARIEWQRCGAAFAELRGELTAEEAREYRRRLEGRRVDELRPRDPAEARAKLRGIVEQAMARLEARREVHEQWEAAAAANQAARLSYDASPEGERLRRFQLAGSRCLLRTLESLGKFRRDGDALHADPVATDESHAPSEGEHPGEPSWPAQADDPADAALRDIESRPPAEEPVGIHLPLSPSAPPSVRRGSPDPAVGPTEGLPIAPEGLVGPRPTIGAIASGVRPSIMHSGEVGRPSPDITDGKSGMDSRPIPEVIDLTISRNEPTAPPDDHADPQVQPTAASDHLPISRDEAMNAATPDHSSGETSTHERVDTIEEEGSRWPDPREATAPGSSPDEPSRPPSWVSRNGNGDRHRGGAR